MTCFPAKCSGEIAISSSTAVVTLFDPGIIQNGHLHGSARIRILTFARTLSHSMYANMCHLYLIFPSDDSFIQIPTVADATRRSDDFLVSIKSTKNNTEELRIAQYLTDQQSTRNHCAPVLEIVEDPSQPHLALIFMPHLQPFNEPEFGTIGEVMDFIRQSLEVLLSLPSPLFPTLTSTLGSKFYARVSGGPPVRMTPVAPELC